MARSQYLYRINVVLKGGMFNDTLEVMLLANPAEAEEVGLWFKWAQDHGHGIRRFDIESVSDEPVVDKGALRKIMREDYGIRLRGPKDWNP